MPTLTVENFSCIDFAEIEFGKLTLIIGPQASGKSVLCKLSYFLVDVAVSQAASIAQGASLERFSEQVKERFLAWFPIGAWGKGKFVISFRSGEYGIKLTRKAYSKKVSEDFRLAFTAEFKAQYEALLTSLKRTAGRIPEEDEFELISYSEDRKIREGSRFSLSKLMGTEAIGSQVFIPAGRSFFTSLDKAIVAFEQAGFLDPLIVRFGRLYSAYKGDAYYASAPHSRPLATKLYDILGGALKGRGEQQRIVTVDGRHIPLSSLSSGQQELLPLACVLPAMVGRRSLCYIEEPEAHLFPRSQSKLIEALVSILAVKESRPSSSRVTPLVSTALVLTTHSPYVLSKVNNLLKAGAIGKSLGESTRLNALKSLVPQDCWLDQEDVRAYAIVDRRAVSIVGKDGLIDGEYLDGVSGDIAEEFNQLLSLEFGHG